MLPAVPCASLSAKGDPTMLPDTDLQLGRRRVLTELFLRGPKSHLKRHDFVLEDPLATKYKPCRPGATLVQKALNMLLRGMYLEAKDAEFHHLDNYDDSA